ncbi:hypothetical protein PoB_002174400 [Plakobranchus ocellatus]|uniref:Uncharacterized protein n=1 Tax=Plakobranchus ocellatus TaxID=259542 RepID=A0AAV3ZLI7_9GAST|nr:hypothetical protein PoB_002174400 [Plakobranchus ocellatus]
MPPTVHIKLGAWPCNVSTITQTPCIISVKLANLTLGDESQEIKAEDDEGAMKFIIAVLLVYSLMGTAGMLILRIRQSASKAHKKGAMKEANQYLKDRNKISAECHKAKLLSETKRILRKMKALDDQKRSSETLNAASSECPEGDQSSRLLPPQSLPIQKHEQSTNQQYFLPPISESVSCPVAPDVYAYPLHPGGIASHYLSDSCPQDSNSNHMAPSLPCFLIPLSSLHHLSNFPFFAPSIPCTDMTTPASLPLISVDGPSIDPYIDKNVVTPTSSPGHEDD